MAESHRYLSTKNSKQWKPLALGKDCRTFVINRLKLIVTKYFDVICIKLWRMKEFGAASPISVFEFIMFMDIWILRKLQSSNTCKKVQTTRGIQHECSESFDTIQPYNLILLNINYLFNLFTNFAVLLLLMRLWKCFRKVKLSYKQISMRLMCLWTAAFKYSPLQLLQFLRKATYNHKTYYQTILAIVDKYDKCTTAHGAINLPIYIVWTRLLICYYVFMHYSYEAINHRKCMYTKNCTWEWCILIKFTKSTSVTIATGTF